MDVELVRAFERAVNAADATAAVSLVTEDVEVGGPRGSAKGLEVFRGWVAGSGIELQTVRLFGRGDVAVAVQVARWHEDDAAHEVATEFVERDGLICRVVRHDDGTDRALATAGLSVADELPVRAAGSPPGGHSALPGPCHRPGAAACTHPNIPTRPTGASDPQSSI